MPGENYQDWSVNAANNGSADSSINWAEGQPRASVNNSSRSEMAAHAKNRNLLNGSIVTGGAANNQTFTSGVGYSGTVPTGLVVKLKIGPSLNNTASSTLNMDGIGDIAIKDTAGNALKGGELVAGSYTDFLFNGTNWVFLYSQDFLLDLIRGGNGIIIGQQIFRTAGTFTYTPTLGTECCIVECVGGGGGGGSVNGGPAYPTSYMQGGGGGSGGYSRKLCTIADIGASQTVTVGAGGFGPNSNQSTGGAGGTTSVGALCIANPGQGGTWAQGGLATPTGGSGGTAGTGDLAVAGNSGGMGQYMYGFGQLTAYAFCGNGAGSVFGGGVSSNIGSINGPSGASPGAGGAGGTTNQTPAANGGAGAAGVVIITEFAGRGVPGHDGATGPQGPAGPTGPGTGDVLRSGAPTVGQIAQWTDASHIQGVAATTLGLVSSVAVQKFTASGTYTPTAGMKFCIIQCVGGGGGGGGATGNPTLMCAGGGGGSGAYSQAVASAASVGASKTVTIGGGGNGSNIASPAGTGGDTSVGALCLAKGGLGGGTAKMGMNQPSPGAGGSAAGGVGNGVLASGAPGEGGLYNAANNIIGANNNNGGSGFFGGGGVGAFASNGDNGFLGGGGAGGHAQANDVSGGTGGAGIVIITEFI